jgi:RNA polymerase sigma factor (sigma-70 family)
VDVRSDNELLRVYAEVGDEAAFGELVSRHLPLVYSVSLRVIVDQHLAQDATQATFAALAKEARHIASHPVLASWLHRTAFNQAAKLVRGEARRRAREQEAFHMQTTEPEGSDEWKNIAPLLDGALDQLAEEDRSLILLRYFERKTAREAATQLNLTEAAAHKRLNRAVIRLRRLLAPATLSATGLAAMLSAEAMVSVPVGLSASITAGVLGSVGVCGAGLTALKVMAMSKLKLSAISALLVVGASTPIVLQQRALNRLRDENSALQQLAQQAEAVRVDKEALAQQLTKRSNDSLSSTQLRELLRLRGEVGLLRKDSQELARLRSGSSESARGPQPQAYLPATAWANVGADKPEAAIQTFFWAGKQRATNVVGNLLRWIRDPEIPASTELDQRFTADLISGSANFAGELEGFRVTSVDVQPDGKDARLGVEVTNDIGNTETHLLRVVQEDNQWFPVMHVWLDGPGSIHASLDVPKKFRTAN